MPLVGALASPQRRRAATQPAKREKKPSTRATHSIVAHDELDPMASSAVTAQERE